MQLATLAVFCRGERGEQERIEAQKAKLEALGAKIRLVENPVNAISSTDLRRMLVFGCADPFLMPGVGDYIREKGLYGLDRNRKNLPMEELESFCYANKILMAIITVPADQAQQVCDKLIACGIKAVWTFAPVHLDVPPHILVQNENMATSLAVLSMHLQAQMKEKK